MASKLTSLSSEHTALTIATAALLSLVALCSSSVIKVQEQQNSLSCLYENKTYGVGEHFKPEPCTFCHCPKHGGRVQCAIQDCMFEPNCVRFEKQTESDCCGRCVEIGCRHSDGQVYSPGTVIVDNDCERCACPEGGGKTICEKVNCPDINCVDFVQEPGSCCPICPNGPNCYLGKKILNGGEILRSGRCRICHCPLGVQPFWRQKRGIHAVCTIGDCQ